MTITKTQVEAGRNEAYKLFVAYLAEEDGPEKMEILGRYTNAWAKYQRMDQRLFMQQANEE